MQQFRVTVLAAPFSLKSAQRLWWFEQNCSLVKMQHFLALHCDMVKHTQMHQMLGRKTAVNSYRYQGSVHLMETGLFISSAACFFFPLTVSSTTENTLYNERKSGTTQWNFIACSILLGLGKCEWCWAPTFLESIWPLFSIFLVLKRYETRNGRGKRAHTPLWKTGPVSWLVSRNPRTAVVYVAVVAASCVMVKVPYRLINH